MQHEHINQSSFVLKIMHSQPLSKTSLWFKMWRYIAALGKLSLHSCTCLSTLLILYTWLQNLLHYWREEEDKKNQVIRGKWRVVGKQKQKQKMTRIVNRDSFRFTDTKCSRNDMTFHHFFWTQIIQIHSRLFPATAPPPQVTTSKTKLSHSLTYWELTRWPPPKQNSLIW